EYGGMAIFAQSMGHAALEMKRRGIEDVALRETLLKAADDVPNKTELSKVAFKVLFERYSHNEQNHFLTLY
ncbi:MAG: hypothetical protein IKT65_07225, partial [Clostridia bacterium]|nr:hypothetical protein [Clostridia bacterium]